MFMGFHFIKITLGLTALILLQSCSSSGGGGSLPIGDPNAPRVVPPDNTVACTSGSGANINITGQITYERVMPDASGALDYSNIQALPVRGATIQILCGATVIASASTNDNDGTYSLTAPGGSQGLIVRVRAELKQVGSTPGWDFTVVDNTREQALYVMDSAPFNVDQADISKNLLAGSGFNNNLSAPAYSSSRVAAPFAILDSVFKARQKVLSVEPQAQFPALKLNWSVNNNSTGGNTLSDIKAGNISSSFFGQPDQTQEPQIYILGDDNSDTDEYDEHVIIHEWGHYFEHYFSRSDSIGGPHSGNDKLDMRVAFGEGFGNAFSGMVTDNPIYKDSTGPSQASGFKINVDDNNCFNKGFYSECSVQAILYDLYDDGTETESNGVESGDNVSMGFLPLYQVLIDQQKNTAALTSIFSFIKPLKDQNPASSNAIDSLTFAQDIQNISDIYGDSETGSTNNPGTNNIFPLYQTINVGDTLNICSTAENRAPLQDKNGNKLGVNRYLRLSLSTNQPVTIEANEASGDIDISSDPDIEVFLNGAQVGIGESTDTNKETLTLTLGSNTEILEYIIVVYNYSYYIGTTTPETTCFNITVTN